MGGQKKAKQQSKEPRSADVAPRRNPKASRRGLFNFSFRQNNMSTIAFILILGGFALAKYEMRRYIRSSYLGGPSLIQNPGGCGTYEPKVPSCTPHGNNCGHLVYDSFASAEEVSALRAIAARGMALGGGAGGPTILDLQSGALSLGDKFVDVWSVFNATEGVKAFTRSEVAVYADVVERIRLLAESTFGVSSGGRATGGGTRGAKLAAASAARLHLTAPTFFSRISGDKQPKTAHDEYWHTHVDLEQYGSFVITSLLYLADAGADFEGGQFEIMPRGTTYKSDGTAQPLTTVTPSRGRLVLFSSGSEHPHRVTRVTSGERLALTIAFSCDEGAAIHDFLGRALPA